MVNCWSFSGSYDPGCWPATVWRWNIDNIANNPTLPLPDYIKKSYGPQCMWSYQADCITNNIISRYWSHFCTPPIGIYSISNPPYQINITRQPVTTGGEYYLDRGFAIAQKIIPTSRCLPYIVFHNIFNMAHDIVPGKRTIIEIRKNDPINNLPMGTPGDNNPNNLFGLISTEFRPLYPANFPYYPFPCNDINYFDPNSYAYTKDDHFAVPINVILDEIDVPVWIVLYSDDYACSNAYLGMRRLQLKKSDVGTTNNVAIFSEATGCQWAIDTSLKNISFLTYIAASCNGTVFINDFAFAKLAQPSIYLNENCLVRLADVQGSKVSIGVIYTNPDPVRTWRRVRFSFAYLKPDLRYFTSTIEVFNISPGQHETFFEMDDYYFIGKYDQLSVSATVIQV